MKAAFKRTAKSRRRLTQSLAGLLNKKGEKIKSKLIVITFLFSVVLPVTMNYGMANATSVRYKAHVAEKGWQEWVSDGQIAGTTGEARQMEAVRIEVSGLPDGAVIKYRSLSANKGWLPWVSGGKISGTTGEARRIEAIQIKLLNTSGWNVKYQVHVSSKGWLPWAADGEIAGTTGVEDGRVKEIRIMKVKGRKPLDSAELKNFETFVTQRADDIVQKWIDYFVLHKKVKFEKVGRKVK